MSALRKGTRKYYEATPLTLGGVEFSDQADTGIAGLLGRHVEVPPSAFKRLIETSTQQELQAGMKPRKRTCALSILGLPMISPLSPIAVSWLAFIAIMDMTYTAYWVPINVAFCSTNYGDLSSNCTGADLAGGIIYAAHLLFSFHIGAVVMQGYRKKLIMDGWLVAKVYVRHGRFLIDLIAVLPFIYLVIIIAGDYTSIRWVAIVSLFRLIRMGRLLSIGNVILQDINQGDEGSPVARFFGGSIPAYIFIILFFATTIINMEGCLMVLVSSFIGKENSWMTSLNWIDIPNASDFYQWYYGIYTAIASNTSTGMFGMQLLHPGEWAVGLFLQVMGALTFTFVATVGLGSITKASSSAMTMYHLRGKLQRVHRWFEKRKIPRGLEIEILAHYHGPWMEREQAVKEDEMVSGMPRHLRETLLQPETEGLISSVHFLGRLNPNIRSLIAQSLVPFDVAKGVELCQEGESARSLWIVEHGTILALNMKGDMHELHGPALIGESLFCGNEVLACRRRLWMFRSVAPCRMWRLSGADVSMLIRLNPDLPLDFLEFLRAKLIRSLTTLTKHEQGDDDDAFSDYVPPWADTEEYCAEQEAAETLDGHWCEFEAAVMGTLVQQPAHIRENVLQQLDMATVHDRSLQLLLDALLAVSTLNRRAAFVLGKALSDPGTVLQSRARCGTSMGERAPYSSQWRASALAPTMEKSSLNERGDISPTSSTHSGSARHSGQRHSGQSTRAGAPTHRDEFAHSVYGRHSSNARHSGQSARAGAPSHPDECVHGVYGRHSAHSGVYGEHSMHGGTRSSRLPVGHNAGEPHSVRSTRSVHSMHSAHSRPMHGERSVHGGVRGVRSTHSMHSARSGVYGERSVHGGAQSTHAGFLGSRRRNTVGLGGRADSMGRSSLVLQLRQAAKSGEGRDTNTLEVPLGSAPVEGVGACEQGGVGVQGHGLRYAQSDSDGIGGGGVQGGGVGVSGAHGVRHARSVSAGAGVQSGGVEVLGGRGLRHVHSEAESVGMGGSIRVHSDAESTREGVGGGDHDSCDRDSGISMSSSRREPPHNQGGGEPSGRAGVLSCPVVQAPYSSATHSSTMHSSAAAGADASQPPGTLPSSSSPTLQPPPSTAALPPHPSLLTSTSSMRERPPFFVLPSISEHQQTPQAPIPHHHSWHGSAQPFAPHAPHVHQQSLQASSHRQQGPQQPARDSVSERDHTDQTS